MKQHHNSRPWQLLSHLSLFLSFKVTAVDWCLKLTTCMSFATIWSGRRRSRRCIGTRSTTMMTGWNTDRAGGTAVTSRRSCRRAWSWALDRRCCFSHLSQQWWLCSTSPCPPDTSLTGCPSSASSRSHLRSRRPCSRSSSSFAQTPPTPGSMKGARRGAQS